MSLFFIIMICKITFDELKFNSTITTYLLAALYKRRDTIIVSKKSADFTDFWTPIRCVQWWWAMLSILIQYVFDTFLQSIDQYNTNMVPNLLECRYFDSCLLQSALDSFNQWSPISRYSTQNSIYFSFKWNLDNKSCELHVSISILLALSIIKLIVSYR